MRATCARVLVAALMTGAIGFALAMPAVFGTAHDAVRSLTAPPSLLRGSVPLVGAASARPTRAGRLEGTRSFSPAVPVAVVTTSGDHSSPTRAPRSPRPAPSPAPQPAPATDTRTLAGDTAAPPVEQPAPSQPATVSGKRRGKGHDKEKSKPAEPAPAPQPLTSPTPAPPAESPPPDNEKDHGHDNGNSNGNSNSNGNGKGKGGNDKERGG
jgi:hypothetical protein